MLNPHFSLPSATTIRKRLDIQVAKFEATALSRVVDGNKVALSLDCWSSTTRLSFMGVIAHYITKDWELVEELIGFESLKHIHSGAALATVVNDLISKFHLTGRVISITTDNASSNGTMIEEINQYLDDAFRSNCFLDSRIQHIPCLAHIIQLVLKALLGSIRVKPTNETFIRNWEEDQQMHELHELKRAHGIPFVLAKVSSNPIILIFILTYIKIRKLAVFVNSSAQRKYAFEQVQHRLIATSSSSLTRVLTLAMDVSTRWDSTGIMLVRAMHLRQAIDIYCTETANARHFALSSIEWQQIGYLIDIVRPFNFLTTTVGKTKGVTLPYGLNVFDELYERLNESHRRLKAKRQEKPWVKVLLKGIEEAIIKLDVYYKKMYGNLGSFYALGAILHPGLKLQAFNPVYSWLGESKDWKVEFEEQFRELYRQSYFKDSNNVEHLQLLRHTNKDPLALMLSRSRYSRDSKILSDRLSSDTGGEVNEDEIDRWLRTCK